MNRADQAPEPSMEELLASIRLIIADAGKGSTLPKEERSAHAAPGGAPGQASPQSASAGDDVFDLTEELVFPEEQAAPAPGPHAQEIQFDARRSQEAPKAAAPAADSEGFPAFASRPDRPANSRPARQEMRGQALSPDFRPVWSRRELPSAASQYQAPSSRPRPDAAAAKSQARNWAGDIQMPVPDQGPVSLIDAGGGRPQLPAPEAAIDSTDEAAAVAALAQKLARSAMGAMGAQELQDAQEVDFEHINAESKTDVSEKFADAIARESAAHGAATLPNLLDEVFRHDFIRQAEASATPEDETSELEISAVEGEPDTAPAMASNEEVHQTEDSTNVQQSAPAAEAAPGLTEGAAAPSAATVPATIQPRAQVQFIGPAQTPAPLQAGLTLEGAVREMLRPLLVQWLNENMPRILENAIREEIATRGVFPKTE